MVAEPDRDRGAAAAPEAQRDEAQPGIDHTGSARRPAIRDSAVATGKGDDGSTGLLFGGARIRKDDPRAEAFGTIDEVVAALGLARAELNLKAQYGVVPAGIQGISEVILRFQRELFVVAAELATTPEARDRQQDGVTRVSEEMVAGLETTLAELEGHITMPREFVVPGETRVSAAIELARVTLRRAERRVVTLHAAGEVTGEWLIAYVNRLADLLWVLARAAEQGESREATPARTPGTRRRPRRAAEAGVAGQGPLERPVE